MKQVLLALVVLSILSAGVSAASLTKGWNLFSPVFGGNATDRDIVLEQGWNLFGYSSDADLYWLSAQITNGAQTLSIADAEAAGWIQATVYFYDSGYKLVPGDSNYLTNNHGYWLYANIDGLILTLPSLPEFAFDWSKAVISDGSESRTLEHPNIGAWIQPTIYYFDQSAYSWVQPGAGSITPDRGYWLYALVDGLTLELPGITVCQTSCQFTTIQQAVDASSPGDQILVMAGIYNEDVDVFYKQNISIIGESVDSVFVKGDFQRPGFWVENSNNILLKGMTVYNQFQGIYMRNSSNSDVHSIHSYNNSLNGMYISTENILIENSSVERNGLHGILIRDSSNSAINRVRAYNNFENGIYIVNSVNITVRESNSSYNRGYHGISTEIADSVSILNSHLDYNNRSGVPANQVSNLRISDSALNSNGRVGATMFFSSNVKINRSEAMHNVHHGFFMVSSNATVEKTRASYNNLSGLDLNFANVTFVGSEVEHNYRGLYVTTAEVALFDTSVYGNIDCDIKKDGQTVCFQDNTPPARITDLVAKPGAINGRIELSWTAVGDNLLNGTADSYIVRYANSTVNDSNFDTATNYEDAQFWIPSASGTVESHQLDEVSLAPNERFWFAIKAVDDSALESNVSNTDDSLSPFHNVVVETAGCINNKNKLNCTDTTIQNTNYLYDIINVSGIINNTGNVNESVEVKLLRNGVELIDSKFINISANSSVLVTDLEWNASQPGSSTLRLRTDIGGEEYKNVENVEVWSIENQCVFNWADPNNFPPSTQSSLNEVWVAANAVCSEHLYGTPVTINIASTPFIINWWQDH